MEEQADCEVVALVVAEVQGFLVVEVVVAGAVAGAEVVAGFGVVVGFVGVVGVWAGLGVVAAVVGMKPVWQTQLHVDGSLVVMIRNPFL